jgi:hypothetical protein
MSFRRSSYVGTGVIHDRDEPSPELVERARIPLCPLGERIDAADLDERLGERFPSGTSELRRLAFDPAGAGDLLVPWLELRHQ